MLILPNAAPPGDASTQALQALTAGAQVALGELRAAAHVQLARLRTPSRAPPPTPAQPGSAA